MVDILGNGVRELLNRQIMLNPFSQSSLILLFVSICELQLIYLRWLQCFQVENRNKVSEAQIFFVSHTLKQLLLLIVHHTHLKRSISCLND